MRHHRCGCRFGGNKLSSLFEELKRRNVFRVGAAYLVASWLIVQLVETIFPAFGFDDGAVRIAVIALAIGLLPVLVLAWAFELTPEGVQREEQVDRSQPGAALNPRKFNLALIILLIAALGFFLLDKLVLSPHRVESSSAISEQPAVPPALESRADEQSVIQERSVAVLPFVAMSRGEDDEYFADGLTEEILNSLASLPELLVTARTSAFYFKGTDLPVPEIAATLGVANVVEGSVRRDGEKVRITAQLIRAADGFHLRSMTYDRTLEDVFAVQEDIARNIAEVLDVVLDEDALARMRNAGIGDVEAFIAYQKGQQAFAEAHDSVDHVSESLALANFWFDQVLAKAPNLTDVRLRRADLKGHALFEIAAGYREETYHGEGTEVVQALLDDYALAWETARPGIERATVEVERTQFSDNWQGLSAKMDAALADGTCELGNWIYQLANPFGRADRVIERLTAALRCDPMAGLSYMGLAQALIWAGQSEAALQTINSGESLHLTIPFVDDVRLVALLAAGQFESEAHAFQASAAGSMYPFPDHFLLEAVAGDPETAREISDEYLARPGVDDYTSLVAAAVVGNREAANTIAARIDGRPGGPFMLSQVLQACFCGAPFDLDATPNFKARLEESGFDWPPPKPIAYPLKTW